MTSFLPLLWLSIWLESMTGFSPYPVWAFDCGLWLAFPLTLPEYLTVAYDRLSPLPWLSDCGLWLAFPYPGWVVDCGLWLAFPLTLSEYLTVVYDWLSKYPGLVFNCGLWLAPPYPGWVFDWSKSGSPLTLAEYLTVIYDWLFPLPWLNIWLPRGKIIWQYPSPDITTRIYFSFVWQNKL